MSEPAEGIVNTNRVERAHDTDQQKKSLRKTRISCRIFASSGESEAGVVDVDELAYKMKEERSNGWDAYEEVCAGQEVKPVFAWNTTIPLRDANVGFKREWLSEDVKQFLETITKVIRKAHNENIVLSFSYLIDHATQVFDVTIRAVVSGHTFPFQDLLPAIKNMLGGATGKLDLSIYTRQDPKRFPLLFSRDSEGRRVLRWDAKKDKHHSDFVVQALEGDETPLKKRRKKRDDASIDMELRADKEQQRLRKRGLADTPNVFRHVGAWGVDWLGNNNVHQTGAYYQLRDNLEEGKVFILSYTNKYGRLWAHVKPEVVLDLIQKYGDIGLYEVLCPTRRRKVYFDVDKSTIPLERIKDAVLEKFPGARLQISGREGSWHIVLSNYHLNDLDSMLPIKLFCVKNKHLDFDEKVYTNFRNFKCLNQSKPCKPIQAYIEGDQDISKHLIMQGFDEDSIDASTLNLEGSGQTLLSFAKATGKTETQPSGSEDAQPKATYTSSSIAVDVLSIPAGNLPVPKDFDWYTATPVQKLSILPCPKRDSPGALSHQVCWRVMVWCKQNGVPFEDFWRWARQKDDNSKRLAKFRDKWSAATDYKVKEAFLKTLLERTFPKLLDRKIAAGLRRHLTIDEEITVEGVDGGFYVEENISADKKFTVLSGPMGANKTGVVVDYLLHHCQGKRVLWLTPRITLSQNTLRRLKKVGIDIINYKDLGTEDKDNGAMDEAQNVICSIQSIHYLVEAFDVLICDEIETTLLTLEKDCHTHSTNLFANWHNFIQFHQKAQKVIYMDALTTRMTTNFIRGLIGSTQPDAVPEEHFEVVNTIKEPQARTFRPVDKFDDWLAELVQRSQDGEKLYVFTPNKKGPKGVDAIAQILTLANPGWQQGSQVRSYFAEKEKEKKDDVEVVWNDPQCRAVVTNSTFSVGVNFNTENVFDRIFCHYSPFLPARDLMQSLYRVRHPKSQEMVLFRSKQCGLGEQKRRKDADFPSCPIFAQLRADIAVEEDANRHENASETFDIFCEKANITIAPPNLEDVALANSDDLQDLKEQVDSIFSYHNIADIDVKRYELHLCNIYSGRGTLQKRLEVEKFRFKSKFEPLHPTDDDDAALHEADRAMVWNENPQLIDRVRQLVGEENCGSTLDVINTRGHIIRRILRENNVQLAQVQPFPQSMKTSIPVQEIKDNFYFRTSIKNHGTGMVSMALNSFFGMYLYVGKRQRDGAKLSYKYETNPKAHRLIRYCLSNRRRPFIEAEAPVL